MSVTGMTQRIDGQAAATVAASSAPSRLNRASQPQPPRRGGSVHRVENMVRGLRADALTVVGWASVAAAIAIFLADHGLSGWSSIAGATKQLGIIFGLVGTDLMILSLLLSARIPFVDKAIGHDKALAKHSDLGSWVLTFILAHGVLLTAAYAIGDKVNIVSEFTSLWSFGDYMLAVIAGGLLTMVAISSIVMSVRKRLPQELWHAIHLTTYVAVAISIPHQFSMSTMFEHGFARTYWIAMYALTAFCLIAFRFLLPLITSLETSLTVSDVRWVSPDTVAITMTGKHLDRLDADGGQFFHWRFMTPKLWWHQHPFSLSAAPDGRSLRITVRDLGKGTNQLIHSVKPGDRVFVEGPYGLFSDAVRTRDSVVLIGAGAGIAPILSVLQDTDTIPGRALVVLRGTAPENIIHFDEIRDACARRGIQLVTLVGRRGGDSTAAGSWLPASAAGAKLIHWAPWLSNANVYVCGPNPWTDAVVAEAQAYGVPDKQIHFERFSW